MQRLPSAARSKRAMLTGAMACDDRRHSSPVRRLACDEHRWMRVSAPNPLVSSVAPVGKSGRSRYCCRGAQESSHRGGLESVSPRAWLLVRELSLKTRRDQRGGEEGRLRATTTCLLMFLCATGKAREICAARGEKPRSSQPVYRAVAVPRAGVEKG